jgi:hypothetical protein
LPCAANRFLKDERLANVAFHLIVLAREEVGNGTLLARGMTRTPGKGVCIHRQAARRSHLQAVLVLRKPVSRVGKLPRDEFVYLRGLARGMHEDRLAAMYVSSVSVEGESYLQRVGCHSACSICEPIDIVRHQSGIWL